MDNLGTFNLFTSHFVIGCKETYLQHTQTITYEIEALHKWMNYKDSDYGMNKYRTERTQYISFLRIIDFNIFQSIVKDLYKIYSVKYKYSDASDFVKNVFDYTIYDLQRIIDLDLIPIGCSPNENKYVFYLLDSDREFIDFAIDSDFDIGN